jgi:hypothetical protein
MTKNRLIIIGLALAVGVLAVWWLLSPKPLRPVTPIPAAQTKQKQPQPTNQGELPQSILKEKSPEEVLQQKIAEGERAKQEQEKAFLTVFNTPIKFWGKVVDQYGKPVEGATVKFSANDKYWESGSKYQTQSDVGGFFSITNAKGISLSVDVEKAGYHRNPQSYGSFSYVSRDSAQDKSIPTSDNPAIFVLRKMGETVPLVHVSERSVRVPKSGSPVEVILETGLTTGQGDLKVQCWTSDQAKDAQGRYDWKCVLTVFGGGLVERNDGFAFEAPAEGYQESVELTPSSERWASNVEKQYFVKLSDNRYARINFRMRTGGEHFFVIESYLNPTPGSRNLEYDPSKKVP